MLNTFYQGILCLVKAASKRRWRSFASTNGPSRNDQSRRAANDSIPGVGEQRNRKPA